MPALVIWGKQDRLIPLSTGDRFAREIHGARSQIIPNCGHEAQIECPGPFNQALLAFLAESQPTSSHK